MRFPVLLLVMSCAWTHAAETPDLIEQYGRLPMFRDMSISPDGTHYAFIQRRGNQELFVVINTVSGEAVAAVDASNLKARSARFATNQHVILEVSKTLSSARIRGKWEQSHAVSFNIDTQAMTTLLVKFEDLYEAQEGLGRIVGINEADNDVYMPAWVRGSRDPAYHLLRADLNTGHTRIYARGNSHTRDWFVSTAGEVLAREDFDDKRNVHTVQSKVSGKWKTIYRQETEIPEIGIHALTPDGTRLVYRGGARTADALYTMSLTDGTIVGPIYEQTDRDIDEILVDGFHRAFKGIRLSGPLPEYIYEDETLAAHIDTVTSRFALSSVTPVSATADRSKLIYHVTGNEGAEDFVLFEPAANRLTRIGLGYPYVESTQIADVSAIRYAARDGLKIPAIVTWPAGSEERKNLPLLVFPHGGPESYDAIAFDWWAQYFARSGYLILQPNFRGSTGYGYDFKFAGRGEWGRKMQDDISDGVKVLVQKGHADPQRVCIMGASYGGYAALAGGAFTPELYRCIIAVAGVSDLPRMLRDERFYSGGSHWAVTYWQRLVGNSRTEQDKLQAVSPVNFADAFTAPVLLIHGRDDSVVPLRQSKRMEKALKRAGVPVELLTLKGEDHWLSSSDTRVATLTAIARFLEQHNPVDTAVVSAVP